MKVKHIIRTTLIAMVFTILWLSGKFDKQNKSRHKNFENDEKVEEN